MKDNKVINVLLVLIMILVVIACGVGYLYFTKEEIITEMNNKLEEQEIIFTLDNYPRIDGSISTLPLAEAFKSNFTGTDIKEIDITHSKTNNAYMNLINGQVDLILVSELSEKQLELARQKGIELETIPIVKDAFVFMVNKSNIVENLTLEQIQHIYSGEIKNWKEVGGNDSNIVAYQRPEDSVSQIGMLSLVMKDKEMIEPTKGTLKESMYDIIDVISDYSNQENAIGYSYYYYATKMYTKGTMKFLSVNGVDPSYENIQTGLYNLQTTYYAVIRKDEPENTNTRKLLEVMKSQRGQNIAKEAGYVQNY